jgi:hypothetical protein
MGLMEHSTQVHLEDVGDGVTQGYRHFQKVITPGDPFIDHGAALKWYDIGSEGKPLSHGLQIQAREALSECPKVWTPSEGGGLGFVFLHDCTSVVFLCTAIWRNNNELWTQIFISTPDAPSFAVQERKPGLHPVFCVWEMGSVWHETGAWNRYLASDRTADDRQIWIADIYDGMVPDAL